LLIVCVLLKNSNGIVVAEQNLLPVSTEPVCFRPTIHRGRRVVSRGKLEGSIIAFLLLPNLIRYVQRNAQPIVDRAVSDIDSANELVESCVYGNALYVAVIHRNPVGSGVAASTKRKIMGVIYGAPRNLVEPIRLTAMVR